MAVSSLKGYAGCRDGLRTGRSDDCGFGTSGSLQEDSARGPMDGGELCRGDGVWMMRECCGCVKDAV